MSNLSLAIALAHAAHAGQLDKLGQPYILHPLRVMLKMPSDDLRTVAILHDIIEDTSMTLEDLGRLGYGRLVLQAIDAMTKREAEPYQDYIKRLCENFFARYVKRYDLLDNMDPARTPQVITPAWERRRKKYEWALGYIDAVMERAA